MCPLQLIVLQNQSVTSCSGLLNITLIFFRTEMPLGEILLVYTCFFSRKNKAASNQILYTSVRNELTDLIYWHFFFLYFCLLLIKCLMTKQGSLLRNRMSFVSQTVLAYFPRVQHIINISAVPEVVIFQMVSLEMFYTS